LNFGRTFKYGVPIALMMQKDEDNDTDDDEYETERRKPPILKTGIEYVEHLDEAAGIHRGTCPDAGSAQVRYSAALR
jgi:hypothetical protein